jgi:integron integrase
MRYHGGGTVITDATLAQPRLTLLGEVRRRLRLKHYSLRTEQAYVYWIRRYIRAHLPRHPRDLGGPEVERFLSELATRDRVAPSTQNQALAALLFLYRDVLAIALPWMDKVVRAKRAPRLPVVLSQRQVRAVLAELSGREALMAGLLYGSGLRLMECLRLRVKDVDLERREMIVRDGKGGKDRRTVLPECLRDALAAQLHQVRVMHARDVDDGFGDTSLPYALSRKYRGAASDIGWQYVFPASRRATDPLDGIQKRHHLDGGSPRGCRQTGQSAYLPALLRHTPAGIRR